MPLTRFDNPQEIRPLVSACIEKYGWMPEHHLDNFLHSADTGYRSVFFLSPEGYGMMGYVAPEKGKWEMVVEPCAPEDARVPFILNVLRDLFASPDTASVSLEIREETHRRIVRGLPEKLRARTVAETLIWPVMALSGYDASLQGPFYKPLRNVRNRFLREHASAMVPADTVPREALHAVLQAWKQNRPATHRAYLPAYRAFVDTGFAGTEQAYALVVDGKPEAFAAGWRIPNSDGYYPAILLHSYACWGLGEMFMMETLGRIKGSGYAFADLGGSDAPLLSFKKRFGPVTTYDTKRFSVVRDDSASR